jgi:hypothetical protein
VRNSIEKEEDIYFFGDLWDQSPSKGIEYNPEVSPEV